MNNLLVDDKDIINGKSPFSAHKNEEKIYDGRIEPISLEHIMFKVKRGHLTSIDYYILECLNKLQFATSRMVTQYLNIIKEQEIIQEKVSNRLRFMCRSNIISRFKFKSDESNTNLRAYCLERAGKYLLLSRNIECNWKMSDNTISLEMMKEKLARNQVLLSYLNKIENLDKKNYRLDDTSIQKQSYSKFVPHLTIKVFNEETKTEKRFIIQVLRSYLGYKEKVIRTFSEIQQFYNTFVITEEQPYPPSLIVCCEDDDHAFTVFKILVKEKLMPKNIEMYFTTDKRCLHEKLEQSLFQFVIKDKKASMNLYNMLDIINNPPFKS